MKKVIFYTAFILVYIVVETFNWAGLLLDELLFPDYKKTEIKEALFIIGMPRSATTFLFDTLGEDRERFTAMKLWEILLAPSVCQKKIVLLLLKIDKKFNYFLRKKLQKWEMRIFSKYSYIHPISLFRIEEDDYLLLHNLSSSILVFIFPGMKKYRSISRFDSKLSPKKQKKIMTFYKKCIKKHMYVFGKDRVYLSKSPSNTSKLQSLKNTFKNGKFVYMLRIPEKTIASTLSMYRAYSDTFYTRTDSKGFVDETLSVADYWYSYPLERIDTWEDGSALILKFEELTSRPDTAINKLYKRFGYEISVEFEKKLNEKKNNSTRYRSLHDHSLDMYGLSESDIRMRYSKVYKRYY